VANAHQSPLLTGIKIMQSVAETIKKVGFKLGGKSPNIVFAGADFEAAVDFVLYGIFRNDECAAFRLVWMKISKRTTTESFTVCLMYGLNKILIIDTKTTN
jgi:hypothetical protein